MWRVAFVANPIFFSWAPERILETFKGLGYQGVSWTLAHLGPESDGMVRLAAMTREQGLDVAEWVVQQDLICRDDKERERRIELVRHCIRQARQAGDAPLNVFTGPASWDPRAPVLGRDISEGEAWGIVEDAFRTWTADAEREGVNLALEAVYGMVCRDYYTSRELISRVDSPRLGVNLDPSHYVLYGNDIPWCVSQWGDRIFHIHIKDAVGRPGRPGQEFDFPPLGAGAVPWGAFFAGLHEVGYNGFLTIEYEAFRYLAGPLGNDPVEAARLSLHALNRLLDMAGLSDRTAQT
jgi:sugar phosphate isomerase/epimerase